MLSELLNGYLAGMTFIVFSHEGTVTKMVGGAVHVLFGAPGASTDGYLKAFPKLETGDPRALGAFASLVGLRPDDRLASFHLKRLLNGTTGTRIDMD
jgi:class 3 adenylate cyclase